MQIQAPLATREDSREIRKEIHPLRLIGARIRDARQKAGLDRAALAERLGVAPDMLRGFEDGTRDIPARTLAAVAKSLAIPIAELFQDLPAPRATQTLPARPPADAALLLAQPEAQGLAAAFERLPDDKARRNVLDLVSDIARFRG